MYKITSKKIILILLILLILIFLHYIKVLQPLENLALSITRPVSVKFYQTSSFVKSRYTNYSETKDQALEIKELKTEINELIVENAQLRVAKEENQKLREYLDFLKRHEYNYVLANIISQGVSIDPQASEGSLVIDRGERHGLISGLLVVDQAGIVIGKIKNVKSESAEIILITSDECRLAASIYGSDKTSGVVEGRLGLTMIMDFIPQSENIVSNDLVITSGLEENIPKGLAIGRVAGVDSSSSEIWQEASIEPLLNFDDLTIVSVLVP